MGDDLKVTLHSHQPAIVDDANAYQRVTPQRRNKTMQKRKFGNSNLEVLAITSSHWFVKGCDSE